MSEIIPLEVYRETIQQWLIHYFKSENVEKSCKIVHLKLQRKQLLLFQNRQHSSLNLTDTNMTGKKNESRRKIPK